MSIQIRANENHNLARGGPEQRTTMRRQPSKLDWRRSWHLDQDTTHHHAVKKDPLQNDQTHFQRLDITT